METVMTALDREYEKIGRPLTREQKVQWQLDDRGDEISRDHRSDSGTNARHQ